MLGDIGRFSAAGVLVLGVLSCGPPASLSAAHFAPPPQWARQLPPALPLAGTIEAHPERRGGPEPTLRLRTPWADHTALLGYGTAHFWATPSKNEIRVSVLLDRTGGQGWSTCSEVEVRIDGHSARVPASFVGRRLSTGVGYQALLLDLEVQQLRRWAETGRGSLSVCGTTVRFDAPQLGSLRGFVERFDAFAAPRGLDELPPYREVGPRPLLLPTEHDDLGLYEA